MNHHLSITKLPLLIVAVAMLPLNFADGQAQPPVAPAPTVDSDPATDADFYLDKAAAKITEIQTFVDSIKTNTDLRQYPFRSVAYSQRDAGQAFETLKLAKTQIDLLSDVANADKLRRHRQLSRRASRLAKYLKSIRTSLQFSLDPSAFPALRADAARFRGIGMMLANTDSFESDPQLAATILKQLPAAQQEANRIAAKYDLLIQQRTIAGMQLAGLERYFESKRKSFEAIVKQQQQILPERIKKNLSVANEALRSRGERRQSPSQNSAAIEKPLGLRSQLRKISADLNLLETIDPRSSRFWLTYHKQLDDLKVAVQNIEPADGYAGEDRGDLEKTISRFSRQDLVRIASVFQARLGLGRLSGVLMVSNG